MKILSLILTIAFSLTAFASGNIQTGSEVLRNFNYGLGCIGTVKSELKNGYIIKFDSYTSADGNTANNCNKMSEEFVFADQVEVAVETKSIEWGGVFGFWANQFKVGDKVLTKRAHNFCPGKIDTIINHHAKVNVDLSVSGCGLMKDYLIHLEDVVLLKDQS